MFRKRIKRGIRGRNMKTRYRKNGESGEEGSFNYFVRYIDVNIISNWKI